MSDADKDNSIRIDADKDKRIERVSTLMDRLSNDRPLAEKLGR